jgi:hypothetical protein
MSNHNNDGFIVVLIIVVFVLTTLFGLSITFKPSNNCKDIDNSTQHSPTR